MLSHIPWAENPPEHLNVQYPVVIMSYARAVTAAMLVYLQQKVSQASVGMVHQKGRQPVVISLNLQGLVATFDFVINIL